MSCFCFFNGTATTVNYTDVHTLSLHDALPISASTTRPLVTPLSPSVVFRAADADALDAVYEGRAEGFSYAREGHPNASLLADKLAWMEGLDSAQGQTGVMTASGMAAISAVLLGLLKIGRASCRARVCQYV